jgi:hypothetical protein
MATDAHSPRAIIGAALARDPDAIVDASIAMLERLANTLIGIIGEPGFETLLFRSVYCVSLDFSWLMFDPRIAPADPEFNGLRRCFEDQDVAQVTAASVLLFNTLIDILTLLIGAHLTTLFLHEALGGAGVEKISKEQHDG